MTVVSTLETILTADLSNFMAGLGQADAALAATALSMEAKALEIATLMGNLGGTAGGAAAGTVLPSVNVGVMLGIDVAATVAASRQNILAGLQSAINTAVGSGVSEGGGQMLRAVFSIVSTVLADVPDIARQIQQHVTQAAALEIFKATVYVDVTVLAHKVILDGLIGSINSAIGGIGGGAGGDTPAVPHFKTGGQTGAYGGIAVLHPHETIRNQAQENALWSGGAGGRGGDTYNVYGESPYELARVLDRARGEMGV